MNFILAHNIFSNYGSGYTLESLNKENYYDLLCLQACMSGEAKAVEFKQSRDNYYSKDGSYGT